MSSSSDDLHDIDWDAAGTFFEYNDPHILSPQHRAVVDGDVENLKKLLKSGKSVNVVDNSGNTPLHMSIMTDRKDVFDFLLTVEDIRLDVANFEEMTPLMMAVTHRRDSYASGLIERGVDLDYRQINGDTALHLAVIVNSTNLAVEILEKGADANARNFSGETPLHIAVENADSEFVHILLYYGAVATVYDDDDFLPFSRCFRQCPEYLQEILFDLTFGSEKIKLKLFTFISPMYRSSEIFYKLLDNTSELVYDDYDLKCFKRELFMLKTEMVKSLFERFPRLYDDLCQFCNPLSNCAHFLQFENGDVSNSTEMFSFLCEKMSTEAPADPHMKQLIQSLITIELPEETLTKLVCTLLSFGFDLHKQDLNMVYLTYGYRQLFKILVHMPIADYRMKHYYERRYFIPRIIYDTELISDAALQIPNVLKFLDEEGIGRVSKFFAVFHLPPSLLQLSRDASRRHLIRTYGVENNCHFFTVLKWLPIPQVYKDILALEKEIYRPPQIPL